MKGKEQISKTVLKNTSLFKIITYYTILKVTMKWQYPISVVFVWESYTSLTLLRNRSIQTCPGNFWQKQKRTEQIMVLSISVLGDLDPMPKRENGRKQNKTGIRKHKRKHPSPLIPAVKRQSQAGRYLWVPGQSHLHSKC